MTWDPYLGPRNPWAARDRAEEEERRHNEQAHDDGGCDPEACELCAEELDHELNLCILERGDCPLCAKERADDDAHDRARDDR